LWGWIYGKTWVNDGDGEDGKGASGLVRDCKHRSAFTWLQNYMKDNVAKNASATVCGKAAGGPRLTVSTSETAIELGQSVTISAELEGASSISYSVSGVQIGTGSEIVWTPTEAGEFTVEVSAESSDGTVKRTVSIKVVEVGPFGGEPASIPGKIEAENYDKGFAGEAFFDLSDGNNCDDYTDYYRSDDIDIKKISDGIAIGHCQKGEWMNYTINVTEDGEYDVVLRVGTGNSDGGKMTISIGDIVKEVSIDQTGEWGSFAEVSVGTMKLTKGVHVLKLSIDKDWIDIDWISFEKDPSSVADYANNNVISVIPNPASSKIEIIGAGYDVKVEFVSLAGSVVKESNKAEISLGDVANGVYMLRITTPNETVVKKLVVKK